MKLVRIQRGDTLFVFCTMYHKSLNMTIHINILCSKFRYHTDPWLAWMDWTAKKYRGKRTSLKDMHNIVSNIQDNMANVDSNSGCFIDKDEDQFKILPVSECFNILKPIKPTTHMPGMPQ